MSASNLGQAMILHHLGFIEIYLSRKLINFIVNQQLCKDTVLLIVNELIKNSYNIGKQKYFQQNWKNPTDYGFVFWPISIKIQLDFMTEKILVF